MSDHLVEEPWYPADRCPHPVSEVSGKIVFGVGVQIERQIRCLACHAEGGYPVTWLDFAKRGGEVLA